MELMFLTLVVFARGLWTEAVSVTGELNDRVTVTCSHSNAYYNIKYFCRGPCANEDVLIRSIQSSKSDGKYSIRDEGNTFYVTINRLTMGDAGTYWCGIERTGVDTYNRVDLTVREAKKKNDQTNAESSGWLVPVVGVVAFALLIMIFLILVRYGRRHIRSCSGKDHDTKQPSQKQMVDGITTSCLTASEDGDTGGWSNSGRVLTDNVYADVTVSSEAPVPSDGPFYSSVSFKTHTACGAASPPPAAVIYSTITY